MPKYLLTNEVIATELWKLLETNPTYSEDLTTKAKVGKSAVCTYFKFRPGVQVTAAGDFPDISLAKSGWRTESALNGSFAAGTWTFKVRLENDTKYGFSVKVAVRLSKSANSDGSNATLIVVSESPNVKALPASAGGSVTDTWTWSASEVTLSNEYLFAEYRIHIEVAATNAAAQCSFACDEDPSVADESITTTTFTPPPQVTTVSASDIGTTYATLNGETANFTATIRGFDWGKQSGNYTDSWTEEGSFPPGSFSHTVTGLDQDTDYYFRAKAYSSETGWIYGDELSFHTLAPGIIFSDGFESGDFSAWTGTEGSTSPTVESNIKHHGTYSMRSNPLINDQEDVYKTGLTATAIMYERFYMYIDSGLPSSNGQWFDCGGIGYNNWQNAVFATLKNIGGNKYWGVTYYIGGVGTYVYESTASNPSEDTWYCLELVRDVTNGRTKLYVDGVLKVDTASNHVGNSNMVWAGVDFVNYAGLDTYHDCVVVADAYIGPEVAGQEYSFTLTETVKSTSTLNIQQEHGYAFTGTVTQTSILQYGAEARQTLTQIVTPTETVTTWQEHTYNLIETATPITTLFYSVEGIQEFIETLTQTVTSSGTTYYWMELSYALTETAKPAATHSYGLEGIFTLIQTITSTETRIILQEQLYSFTQTTTLQTILTYAAELAEVFITNIETVNPQGNIYYWIEELITPLDWSIIAIGLAAVAFIIAAVAIATR